MEVMRDVFCWMDVWCSWMYLFINGRCTCFTEDVIYAFLEIGDELDRILANNDVVSYKQQLTQSDTCHTEDSIL